MLRDTELVIPEAAAEFLRRTIGVSHGNEVLFLGRVSWDETPEASRAVLEELDVAARGNRHSVAAIIDQAVDWDLVIHNHPSGQLDPSDADTAIAHDLGQRGVGFVIIDSSAERHYLVVPPFRQEREQQVDLEQVEWLLGEKGPLAERLEGYEPREGQIAMALEVARSLNEKQVLACEAGTGIGKSFAYLIPAILWARAHREKIIVSTGTIHLQEQLVHKDLPFLEKVLDIDFRYALAKGRNNYACRRKASELPEEIKASPPGEEEREALEELIAWAGDTDEGSLATLPARPRPEIWEWIMSESDKSLKSKCPHYANCFYYQARREANRADILVVNHHLFFADLSVRRQTGNYSNNLILPAYKRVIFDEAHHLEDVSSDHFSHRFSRRSVRRRLTRMYGPGGRKGRLEVLRKKLINWGDSACADQLKRVYLDRLSESVTSIDNRFEDIELFVEHSGDVDAADGADFGDRSKIRFRPESPDMKLWNAVKEQLFAIRAELGRISGLNDRAEQLLEQARITADSRASSILEIESFRSRLEHLIIQIDSFCDWEDTALVRWIDPRDGASARNSGSVSFSAVPIRVADQLLASVYHPLRSVLLTSATISVAGSTKFLGDRLGFHQIEKDHFAFHSFDSPFDYAKQVLTVIPGDLPAPGGPMYEPKLIDMIYRIVRATRGRAFVLFTSYALLSKAFDALEKPLRDLGIRSLAQGQAQRSELLRRFREDGDHVLFGTDSFWEGVDVKGRALECVIITRLPFRVPSDPLQAARLEEIESRGLNAFVHFTVPQAVLRFKQGFGRLIRSKSDRGVVAVLDQRVLSKRYGKTFLESLPPARILSGDSDSTIEAIEEFFHREG